MPPESRLTARPLMPTGRPPAPGSVSYTHLSPSTSSGAEPPTPLLPFSFSCLLYTSQYIVQAAILLVGYLFLLWMCAPQRKRARLPLAASIPLWAAILGYTYAFFFTGMLPALDIYTQQWVTQRNGFLLNFTVALRYLSLIHI